jgi:hypothetical protein
MEVMEMTSREMKSKVMRLGNRLTAETGDRSAAFVRAWAIVKAGAVEIAVRGVSFGTRQEALRRLAGYNPADIKAFIMPKPENKADPAALAVMVMVQGGRGVYRLGYIPREMTGIARAMRSRPAIRVITGDINGARLRLAI